LGGEGRREGKKRLHQGFAGQASVLFWAHGQASSEKLEVGKDSGRGWKREPHMLSNGPLAKEAGSLNRRTKRGSKEIENKKKTRGQETPGGGTGEIFSFGQISCRAGNTAWLWAKTREKAWGKRYSKGEMGPKRFPSQAGKTGYIRPPSHNPELCTGGGEGKKGWKKLVAEKEICREQESVSTAKKKKKKKKKSTKKKKTT